MAKVKPFRRRGGFFAACALGALLAAAPSAGAATIGGGTIDVNFSRSFLNKADASVRSQGFAERDGREISIPIDSDGGEVDLNARPNGTLNTGEGDGFQLRSGRRRASFDECTAALTGAKARLRCGGTTLMQGSLRGDRLEPDAEFTMLQGTVPLKLTRAGARLLNRRLDPDKNLKRPRAGSMTIEAQRVVEIQEGTSRTVYDRAFIDGLSACDITLGTVEPATPIPAGGAGGERGGVSLPQAPGGRINAVTLEGTIGQTGGTILTRPASSPRGEYESRILNLQFQLGSGNPLTADVPRLGLTGFVIGNVNNATLALDLTETGGTMRLSGGVLAISAVAVSALRTDASCETIPDGALIGVVDGDSRVL